jgi:hypothetical protein
VVWPEHHSLLHAIEQFQTVEHLSVERKHDHVELAGRGLRVEVQSDLLLQKDKLVFYFVDASLTDLSANLHDDSNWIEKCRLVAFLSLDAFLVIVLLGELFQQNKCLFRHFCIFEFICHHEDQP